jgi:thiamine biosynthesis lipoprotein
MGTTVTLVGPAGGGPEHGAAFELAAVGVEVVFAEVERRFTRFRLDSELSTVNRRAGRPTKVSRPFAELLAFALSAARQTGGLFDPTILPALVAAGYDRDFTEIRTGGTVPRDPGPPAGRWDEVEVADRMVRMPSGAALDFGGVAKGWAVDRALRAATDSGLTWALVDAGGDLAVSGRTPPGGVEVAVEDPQARGRELLRLRLEGGALATSSVTSRTWGPGLHQLIDPRTSRPARTDTVQATVWAGTCAEAEVQATWALLRGPQALDSVSGLLAMSDGRVLVNLEAVGVAGDGVVAGMTA